MTDDIPQAQPSMRTAEVARVLRVSARAVRSWADAGRIGCYRTFGGHRLFPLSEVRRVLAELYGEPGPGAGEEQDAGGDTSQTRRPGGD